MKLKIFDISNDIQVIKEILRKYETSKQIQEHKISLIEIVTELLYMKRENPEELEYSSLSRFYFCRLH